MTLIKKGGVFHAKFRDASGMAILVAEWEKFVAARHILGDS